jgi:ribosomal protein L32E
MRRVPLLEKIVARLSGCTEHQLKQLKERLLAGAQPDLGPAMLSYIFNRELGYRPRLRLCRSQVSYGGHDLPAHTSELIAALKLREQKRIKNPDFTRYLHKERNLSASYRRQKGLHNKRRREVEGRGTNVKIGYRTPRLCRHFGPSGYPETLVRDEKMMEAIDPRSGVIRIAKVGLRLRFRLEHLARIKRVWVANAFKWSLHATTE